jgi:hypothetical protein
MVQIWFGIRVELVPPLLDIDSECEHTKLTTEEVDAKNWLEPNSPAHKKLQQIVYNPRFLHTFGYYVNFR